MKHLVIPSEIKGKIVRIECRHLLDYEGVQLKHTEYQTLKKIQFNIDIF